MTTIPFDNYEINPCRRFEEPNKPGFYFYEVCKPQEADCWTLYGHIPGQGVEAIADCETIEQAEELYQRISGESFDTHNQVEARLRLMHAAPKLLEALRLAEHFVSGFEDDELQEGVDHLLATIRNSIAEATKEGQDRIK